MNRPGSGSSSHLTLSQESEKANYTETVPSLINRLKSCNKTNDFLTLIAMYVKVGLNHPVGTKIEITSLFFQKSSLILTVVEM